MTRFMVNLDYVSDVEHVTNELVVGFTDENVVDVDSCDCVESLAQQTNSLLRCLH